MKTRNQGEGDKAAAERFNVDEQSFVKRGGAARKPDATQPGDAEAVVAGKARAKRGDQDAIDAATMRDKTAHKP
jgi:hypothetical protein